MAEYGECEWAELPEGVLAAVMVHLERLLPAMRDAGLISLDRLKWQLTEDGRNSITKEKAQVSTFAISCLARVLIIFRF